MQAKINKKKASRTGFVHGKSTGVKLDEIHTKRSTSFPSDLLLDDKGFGNAW
jgi:hypothetical protein